MSDALAAPAILTPHALPMFKDGDGIVKGTKRKREKDRQDPRKSRRPELPVTGPARGDGWGECDAAHRSELGTGYDTRRRSTGSATQICGTGRLRPAMDCR
ncbi:hypothetical protein L210DRAFT_3512336 [Boletus edulis BED1]|uniref:Uncharacterized protein n=1 Tax=Boletus edulis BED1 TaxID=1328754 RepID=A0AAD4G5R1_BOLED|nr:hypothetical protein L210DRAFT_3512336 [Boletus edulis BED1]